MDSSIGHTRSTILTPEAVPTSQISFIQYQGSVTPSSGLSEDIEPPTISSSGSDTYSRSILPSPPQYISSITSLSSFAEHGSPTNPLSLGILSPFQQQPEWADTCGSLASSLYIRPRSTLPMLSIYSLQSI
jgi:hypothetical protein